MLHGLETTTITLGPFTSEGLVIHEEDIQIGPIRLLIEQYQSGVKIRLFRITWLGEQKHLVSKFFRAVLNEQSK